MFALEWEVILRHFGEDLPTEVFVVELILYWSWIIARL